MISLFLDSRSAFRVWISEGWDEDSEEALSEDLEVSSLFVSSLGAVAESEYHRGDSLVLDG